MVKGHTGSVARREGDDRLSRGSVLPLEQQASPTGPDLVDVPPDVLVRDPGLELLPHLQFLVIEKFFWYLNDIVQKLPGNQYINTFRVNYSAVDVEIYLSSL